MTAARVVGGSGMAGRDLISTSREGGRDPVVTTVNGELVMASCRTEVMASCRTEVMAQSPSPYAEEQKNGSDETSRRKGWEELGRRRDARRPMQRRGASWPQEPTTLRPSGAHRRPHGLLNMQSIVF